MDQDHMTTGFTDAQLPWEGAFVLEDFRKLRLSLGIDAAKSYMYLSRQVQRWPKQLVLHVCRIECALRVNDQDAIYAAVLDLFYILEDKGHALRERMLCKASHHLSIVQQSALERGLNGQLSSQGMPYSSCSVLHDGSNANSEENDFLLITKTHNQAMTLDPLDTARLCLEAGQIEQAQEILESQLEVETERAEIRRDLLEIYCATRDTAGFMNSYQLLQIRGCLDQSWIDSVSLFSTSKM